MYDRYDRKPIKGHTIHTNGEGKSINLYFHKEEQVRAWLQAGGYVYNTTEIAQLWNDGLHGIYDRTGATDEHAPSKPLLQRLFARLFG
jgi:transposase InsO family protein